MFVADGAVRWSATDLATASTCEYALLRRLDAQLHPDTVAAPPENPLVERLAVLGMEHEQRILAGLRDEHGAGLVELVPCDPPLSDERLRALHERTLAALSVPEHTAVYQPGFYDGEFVGYADLAVRTPLGWQVADAKLSRHARPQALLQLAAYADQLTASGLRVAPHARLLLGSGQVVEAPLVDVLPVFRERRARLRELLATHLADEAPVAWGDPRYRACGRCEVCAQAVEEHQDLLLVAGLRVDHRRALHRAGITTLPQLAEATTPPDGLAAQTFKRLQKQAALQRDQLARGPDEQGRPQVGYELRDDAGEALSRLPAPSPGDLFFDFEGDPLYHEDDLDRWGLEYLWGLLTAPDDDHPDGAFAALWAHTHAEERAALQEFVALVTDRLHRHPDLHIYHYAAYEVSALKRMVARYQVCERELDDLLRAGVFVDLYATVRGAVRVSQPSYSIKKLEPLYMGDELREGEVQAGDESIVEYHEYRALAQADAGAAQAKLDEIAQYNHYDCLSTLRLRDWLLARAADLGVEPGSYARGRHAAAQERSEPDAEQQVLHDELRTRSGPEVPAERTAEEQAYALLAAALDYHRREERPAWWAHFDRLAHPLSEWEHQRDVFRIDSAEVLEDWAVPEGRSTKPRRRLRLTGEWGPGSTPGAKAGVVYAAPGPPNLDADPQHLFGYAGDCDIEVDVADDGSVELVEAVAAESKHSHVPVALVPPTPLRTEPIRRAIARVAAKAVEDRAGEARSLPAGPVFDLLARRPPRLAAAETLPSSGEVVEDLVAALLALDRSYLAVQGPPGTGKTTTAAAVIRRLVVDHGWRIGVVAQSHATVEHVLDGVVRAGLDPSRVGKSERRHSTGRWRDLKANARVPFVTEAATEGRGCVLGGTAWTFSAEGLTEAGPLDLLVVDEAGQFALAPTIGVSQCAQRLLLLGDPQQLPQVSQGTHPEPVDRSALGWLMDGHDTLPPELGYFLGTTYRMHPALAEKVSTLSYDGRLGAAACTAERDLAGIAPGLRVVEVPHSGNRTESVEEAEEVARQIAGLMGTPWTGPTGDAAPRPLGQGDVLVVAPYNAQVALLRRTLADRGLEEVRVGTVDKFQGQEAPVVLVSMTASSHGDVPRGMGFLLHRNRVNVAISRAQWLAILVRSPELTTYLPRDTRGLLELGAFLGLGEPVTPPAAGG